MWFLPMLGADDLRHGMAEGATDQMHEARHP